MRDDRHIFDPDDFAESAATQRRRPTNDWRVITVLALMLAFAVVCIVMVAVTGLSGVR